MLAVQFSYSVQLKRRKKERSCSSEEQSGRQTEGEIVYFSLKNLVIPGRFKDRSGILKGESLKLIAHVHVSSKECAFGFVRDGRYPVISAGS